MTHAVVRPPSKFIDLFVSRPVHSSIRIMTTDSGQEKARQQKRQHRPVSAVRTKGPSSEHLLGSTTDRLQAVLIRCRVPYERSGLEWPRRRAAKQTRWWNDESGCSCKMLRRSTARQRRYERHRSTTTNSYYTLRPHRQRAVASTDRRRQTNSRPTLSQPVKTTSL